MIQERTRRRQVRCVRVNLREGVHLQCGIRAAHAFAVAVRRGVL